MPSTDVILTDARSLLDETTATFWTQAQLLRWVNYTQMRLFRRIVQAYEDYFMVTATQNLTSGTDNYNQPSQFWKMRRMELQDTDGTNRSVILPVPLNEIDRFVDTLNSPSGSGRDFRYFFDEDEFFLVPTPRQAGKRVKMWYIQYPSDLTDSAGSTSRLPVPVHELLVIGTAIQAKIKAEEAHKEMKQDFNEQFADFIETIEQRQSQRAEYVHLEDQGAENIGFQWR